MDLSIGLGKTGEALPTEISINGFAIDSVFAGHKYKFVKFMIKTIYERILTSALESLSMNPKDADKINLSAASSYSPYSEGFIYHLAKACSNKSSTKIYIVNLSNGRRLFSDKEPEGIYTTVNLDFSRFEEASLICAISAMLFDCLDAAAKGIRASQTILLKLEKLSEQIADKKTKAAVETQIKTFEEAYKSGKVAYTSSGSDVSFVSYDVTPSEKSISFCFGLLSIVTGYPAEFFNGLGGSTLSDTGASTEKAIHRADHKYASQIINPFLFEVFSVALKPKPLFENLTELPQIITFIETSDILSEEDKKKILNSYGLDGEFTRD